MSSEQQRPVFDPPISDDLQEEVEMMFHMADITIRNLLALARGEFLPNLTAEDYRTIALTLGDAWIERYCEVDLRLELEASR